VISVTAMSKSRAHARVLEEVSLAGAEGTVTAIVGPSGSGKSTLLRCLNGLETFESGGVEIAGHRLEPGPHAPARLELLRRDVGMVFQQFNLFAHLSVLDNVCLAPRVVLGVPAADARGRGLARALAMRPRVILFDEPTSALDPAMTGEVQEVIVDLARGGQTMVVVTHDHAFAKQAASWVVELDAGRVARQGPAADML
jgi:ABC-type polar amino acid transport system ATPase subunit